VGPIGVSPVESIFKNRLEAGSPHRQDACATVKRATLILVLLLAFSVRAGDKKVDVAKVHGKIQFVNSFPDYKVQAVTSFADLHVEIVTSFPDKPGQWQIVESFPDYKIEMVNSFPDFTIQYVKSFPGPTK
jgi:hypothetical protein